MPNQRIYNRKVYMLIEKKWRDGAKKSFIQQRTSLESYCRSYRKSCMHVDHILSLAGMNGERICDEITVTFFSPNRSSTVIRPIQDDSLVPALFEENQPDSNTFFNSYFLTNCRSVVWHKEQWRRIYNYLY